MSFSLRQGEAFDYTIDGPLLSADALKQRKPVHRKSTGMDCLMLPQQFPNRTGLFLETGQRNMRPESTFFLHESTRCQSLIERITQPGQFFHWLHPGPEVLRVIGVAKATNTADGQIKRLNGQIPGRITNVRELLRFHISQKRHSEMQLILPLPTRTGHRLLNRQQPLFDRLRNFQPKEQA